MTDLSASTKDGNTKKEVVSVADQEVTKISPNHVVVEIKAESETKRWPVLYKVPPQLRENKKHIYDPVVLSLGPYHHGQPQFHRAEELKDEVLNIICGAKDKRFLCGKIQERVDEIRHFYGGVSKDEYNDEALAEMMLRDGCFVVYYMKTATGCDNDDEEENFYILEHRLGISGIAFMARDFFMLENQIPFWLIKLLISLIYDGNENRSQALIYNYLSCNSFGEYRLGRVPWKDDEAEPLHLLEALCRMSLFVEEDSAVPIKSHHRWISNWRWRRRKSSKSCIFENSSCQFRSVTDLKAKGIHFEPSSYCLKDIRFSSQLFLGKLQLPIWYFTYNSKVFFSNAIAMEMSPETDTDLAVVSYIDFMKSLIVSSKDVKELREKRILFSRLANDEEVVRMFKEIETYGIFNENIFLDVKKRIEEHCNSKAKTWMAELTYTYFRSPWTAIALFAAIFLLCLTFLQTY